MSTSSYPRMHLRTCFSQTTHCDFQAGDAQFVVAGGFDACWFGPLVVLSCFYKTRQHQLSVPGHSFVCYNGVVDKPRLSANSGISNLSVVFNHSKDCFRLSV